MRGNRVSAQLSELRALKPLCDLDTRETVELSRLVGEVAGAVDRAGALEAQSWVLGPCMGHCWARPGQLGAAMQGRLLSEPEDLDTCGHHSRPPL